MGQEQKRQELIPRDHPAKLARRHATRPRGLYASLGSGGMRTTAPLWPWPMNARIIQAMQRAGYTSPVDVTAHMEMIFGSIPSQCKSP
jgi:hypothetical protein